MSSNVQRVVQCNEKDQDTLLIFKKGIIDPYGMILTWSTKKDCCAWEGVSCDNITNRVTKLDLKSYFLEGEFNLSILRLEFLSYLDLSMNNFNVTNIPSIQYNITYASKLVFLDLSLNFYLQMDNLHWLSPLSSLKYLNLSTIDLHKIRNWLQIVTKLPSLLELQLSDCKLNNFMINPSINYLNLSSLVTLDLSNNNFTSNIPNEIFNFTKDVTYLYLYGSNIHGEIPLSLVNLKNLKHLDLSQNLLKGSIPYGIGQLTHIEELDLSSNMLSGSIPSTLNLSSLYYLSLASNSFSGEISNKTFSKFSGLDSLDLSNSNFVFKFDLKWVPPFQISRLYLGNTNQGPNFPSWIYTQKSLQILDLSSSGISSIDRNKFWSFIEEITYLHLSNNSITGDISNVTLKSSSITLDHNNFIGGLPNLSPKTNYIDLSYNSFSGSIPQNWKNLHDLSYLNLWSNNLSGEVSMHLCNWKQLKFINLEQNEFYGTIPNNMSQKLSVIILRSNKFEGNIPTHLFNLSSLFHLDLAHNKLSGTIPNCVYNMTQMINLNEDTWYTYNIDLFTKGHDYVSNVDQGRRTIDLSCNRLSGKLPFDLFRLVQVQTLNLSHNNLNGTIPNTIGGMKNMESFDLSDNNLCGEIPQSMTLLNFLDYMDLSYNNFSGKIPMGTQLQSFDASRYIGNKNLCGAPLNNNCSKIDEEEESMENEDDESIRESLYLGMGVGFAVGFWGVCGFLFLIRKWRHACFRFMDEVCDKLYVTLMVKLNSFRRN